MIRILPPTPLGALTRSARNALPFPLEEPNCSLFSLGRHALWQGVQALNLGPGDEVLVPAYHHGSEVEALIAAELSCRFYDTGPKLEPDGEELDRLRNDRVKALHLTHYLGFPQDTSRWRSWCDERGLLLLEDAAQGWLARDHGEPLGSVGDLAIFCLYKAIGVPDGGALIVNAPAPRPESQQAHDLTRLARGHLAWVLQRANGLGKLASRRSNGRAYVASEDFALRDPGAPASSATTLLLPRLADENAAAARRANYRILLDALASSVPEPFGSVPAGASPFAFPVVTDDKRGLLQRMAAAGVSAVDLWSEPHPALPAAGFPEAASRRQRIVALPVHQELRPEDLERIADAAVRDRVRSPDLRATIHHSFEPVAKEWDDLAEASGNLFSTREWAQVWWNHFGRGRRMMLTQYRNRRGDTVAIAPLHLASERPLRILRFIGHGPGDQLGPVCAPDDQMRVGHALARSLGQRLLPWDIFLAEQLPGDKAWAKVLGGVALVREGSPVVHFAGRDWEAFIAGLSSKLRQAVGYHERRLARTHEIRFRLSEDQAQLTADLDQLFNLHAQQWGARSSAFGGEREAFHRDFARTAFDRGWVRLWLLEVDGEPVAANYNFRFAGIESFYQAGRDQTWNRFSVGLIVLVHALRSALEEGVGEYRLLRGGEQYKYRFADADPGLETVGLGRGAIGGALLSAGARAQHFAPVASLRHLLRE